MNPAVRTKLLNNATLQALADCGNHMLPHSLLITTMQFGVMPRPTKLECEQRITALEDGNYIVGVTADLVGEKKWRITDLGRTELF